MIDCMHVCGVLLLVNMFGYLSLSFVVWLCRRVVSILRIFCLAHFKCYFIHLCLSAGITAVKAICE